MQLYRINRSVPDDTNLMRILAIDTATNACSAALLNNDKIFERFEIAPRQHTQLLLPMIEEVLKNGATKVSDLDAIAFVAGPGSFTGIRIATSMAQGLSLGLNIPVIALSSLLVLALGARKRFEHTEVLPCIDARREQVYWAHYSFENVSENLEPVIIVQDNLTHADEMLAAMPSNGLIYGTGVDNMVNSETPNYPRASDLLEIAAARLAGGSFSLAGDAQAIYFRRGL